MTNPAPDVPDVGGKTVRTAAENAVLVGLAEWDVVERTLPKGVNELGRVVRVTEKGNVTVMWSARETPQRPLYVLPQIQYTQSSVHHSTIAKVRAERAKDYEHLHRAALVGGKS